MKKTVSILFLFFGFVTISAQTATYITDIQTPALDETSGLLFYNNNIITHNDSGDAANLYEIDAATGAITRTVAIANATNIDWEDLTQDATYIYIGDIGNNYGSRSDLKIYKISKDDYNDADDIATAEIIPYSYANQNDFTSNLNATNWDAEGLISFGDKLLIFSKNWEDSRVDVYSIPKVSGTHSAILESSYNTNGLITSADTSLDESVIYLAGYSSSEAPFMYTIHNMPQSSLDVFAGTVSEKIVAIVPIGNQVEAISLFEITPTMHRLYITNEKYAVTIGPVTIPFPAKLWSIEIDTDTVTSSVQNVDEVTLTIFPNPFDTTLNLSETVDEIIIFDLFGRVVVEQQFVEELLLEHLNTGLYIAHIKTNNSRVIRKIMKK